VEEGEYEREGNEIKDKGIGRVEKIDEKIKYRVEEVRGEKGRIMKRRK
jgi:hypothetical protein